MAPLPPDLLMGHTLIDTQHEQIISLITAFRTAVVNDSLDSVQLRIFLSSIHDYCVMHFRVEEEHMVQVAYPARRAHREEHIKFWERLIGMMERCEEGDFTPSCGEMIYAEVGAWLKDHIHGEDKALAAWTQVLNGTGPKTA